MYKEEKIPHVSEETIHAYEYLIQIVLRKISAPPDLRDDLLQEGRIGLLDAVRKYDPRYNTVFSTYARYRIYGAMIDLLRRVDPLSRNARRIVKKIEQEIDDITHHHHPHTWDTLLDVVPEQETDNPTLNALIDREHAKIIREAVAQLPVKERQIINCYYGHDLTLREVGEMLHLTQGRISQLRIQACAQLKELLAHRREELNT